MKICELEEYLEEEKPVSGFFLLAKDEEHRELVEEDYIHIAELNLNVHVGLWETYTEENQFETDFDFYIFFDSDTKKCVHSEQGSSLITCIHNYTGLEWDEIEALRCEYTSGNR